MGPAASATARGSASGSRSRAGRMPRWPPLQVVHQITLFWHPFSPWILAPRCNTTPPRMGSFLCMYCAF